MTIEEYINLLRACNVDVSVTIKEQLPRKKYVLAKDAKSYKVEYYKINRYTVSINGELVFSKHYLTEFQVKEYLQSIIRVLGE